MAKDRLAAYADKRDFARTREPEALGQGARSGSSRSGLSRSGTSRSGPPRFVVQKHDARRLHYDFRLEHDGVLLSWAVTKGPSPDPRQKRLAVRTEDHPLDYADFEGTIPEGEYGGGTVMLWDEGTWEPRTDVGRGLDKGELKMTLQGQRMSGNWVIVRMNEERGRENWLLIKERDDETAAADALTGGTARSVRTGRTMRQIAEDTPPEEASGGGQGARESGPSKAGDKGGRRAAGPRKRSRNAPAFRKPQLATLVDEAPQGEEWWHETKFDGYRALAALGKGGVTLYTRNGKDWTDRFAALAGGFDGIACDAALIDGEVMAAKVEGSAFSSLQRALSEGGGLVYFAFDLLELDGQDLTARPLAERRGLLAGLMEDLPADGPVRMSQHVVGRGPEVYAAACRAGAEGIVSKKADAPYRSTRSRTWRKVKCGQRQEFVVGGVAPSDKPGRPFSSLLLGTYGAEGLVYRGRVGTGFSGDELERLDRRLKRRKTSPFAEVPKSVARGAKWVRPDTVVEVAFTEFTADGHIRHGAYQGERHDKSAREVTDEDRAAAGASGAGREDDMDAKPEVAGIAISSPGREVFPQAGCTKFDVARHYERVGERMAEIIRGRPLSIVRCPEGLAKQCFYQKHAGQGLPEAIGTVEVDEKDGGTEEYIAISDTAGLVAAAQMGTLEVHMWGARADRLDRPDRIVFDLDPGEGVDWPRVRAAAVEVGDRLEALGITSGALVTGGKGVHVWAPLRRTASWETVKGFAQTLAHGLAQEAPDDFVATMSKAKRKGRIYVDWLRNERGATAIAPYSLRARPGGPVAVPVTWEELKGLESADAFRMGDIAARLERDCPYAALADDLQSITRETVERLEDWMG
jgi:bifunctional non-homologous end joining protein LigD